LGGRLAGVDLAGAFGYWQIIAVSSPTASSCELCSDASLSQGKVRYPAYFDVLAKELLKHLLTGDLTKRYGNLRGGSADIFSHGWFAEVDWDKLYKREIPAPYVPKIEGDGDASQ
jgi:serine/threonine protein kinase